MLLTGTSTYFEAAFTYKYINNKFTFEGRKQKVHNHNTIEYINVQYNQARDKSGLTGGEEFIYSGLTEI